MKKNKNWRNLSVLFIAIIFLAGYTIHKEDAETVHIYITPRNVNYGFGDMGVFKFPLKQQSVMVPYRDRSFMTIIKSDSVCELFYKKEILSQSFSTSLKLSHKTVILDTFLFPRILILLEHRNIKDSFLIDGNYNVSYQNKSYKINKELKNYLVKIMPADIKDNWINDRLAR